jgi:hypothetical protein
VAVSSAVSLTVAVADAAAGAVAYLMPRVSTALTTLMAQPSSSRKCEFHIYFGLLIFFNLRKIMAIKLD